MTKAADAGVETLMSPVESLSLLPSGEVEVATADDRYHARCAIVATGARLRKLHVPGEEEFEHRGVSHCADCDGPFVQRTNRGRRRRRRLGAAGGGGTRRVLRGGARRPSRCCFLGTRSVRSYRARRSAHQRALRHRRGSDRRPERRRGRHAAQRAVRCDVEAAVHGILRVRRTGRIRLLRPPCRDGGRGASR